MQERKPRFTSLSGFDINRVYTRNDLKDWSPDEELGAPGAISVHPRCLSDYVSWPALDHPTVRRLRIGGGHQPSVQISPPTWAKRPECRV